MPAPPDFFCLSSILCYILCFLFSIIRSLFSIICYLFPLLLRHAIDKRVAAPVLSQLAFGQGGGPRVTVEAVQRYLDIELDKIFNQGETHECSRARGEDLEHKGLARILY